MISISSTNLAQDREKVHVLKPSIKRSPSLPTNLAQDRERKHEKDKPKGVPLKARKFAKSDYEPLLSDNEETDDIPN